MQAEQMMMLMDRQNKLCEAFKRMSVPSSLANDDGISSEEDEEEDDDVVK